ncbi:hypothetical protein BJX61DRAFT_144861 [Aspergillus egyptiacus]|nr:hypothetical protein BJX61DRAFT_144861 [Aspergillus egyptiacus]
MQFIKSLSDHLLHRSPQPPSAPDLPTDHTITSDAAPQRPVRNAISPVPPGSEFAPFDPVTQPKRIQSYAKGSGPDQKPPSVRRLLRQSVPHSRLGMPPLREAGSIRNKETSADELRLFPGRGKQDPDAVPIVPGQTFWPNSKPQKKNLKSIPSGPRPVDTISRGIKESGPVHVRGREPKFVNSQNRSALSPPRPSDVTDTQERSSKRRRVESPEGSAKVISISDDEGLEGSTTRRSPVATRTNAQSPTPSQIANGVKMPRDYNHGQRSEYRNVEDSTRVRRPSPKKNAKSFYRFSSEDQDLTFTRDATKERRRESLLPGVEPDHAPRKLPEQTSNLSVEILTKPTPRGDSTTGSSTNRKPRLSISRESPDELQGDVTVGPVPTYLSKRETGIRSDAPSSDIRPTEFTSGGKRKNRRNKKAKSTKKEQAPQVFRVFYFRGGAIIRDTLGGENDLLVVDSARQEVTVRIADAGYERTIALSKVTKVLFGDESSRKIRLELSKVSGEDNRLDVELSSEKEKDSFCSLAQKLEIKTQERQGQWMDNAFKMAQREHKGFAESYKRPLVLVDNTEEARKLPTLSSKRVKLSEALQDNLKDIPARKSAGSDTGPTKHGNSLAPSPKPGETPNFERPSTPPSAPDRGEGTEIPVKKFNSSPQGTLRATRSMSRRTPTTVVCDDDDVENDEDPAPQPSLDVDQKWAKKPLVYPRYGKKKAEVNAVDLERLAPHQFLNDNIIGFYIRFLEDHLQRCNADVAKRVYFFNSYFFATLTNSPRGRRSINYEGVEKWTRSVDLFSYDYIVVPINEDAHWYVAIICNLPYLEGISDEIKPSSETPSEIQEVAETPEPSQRVDERAASTDPQPTTEQTARSLASMNLLDKEGPEMEGSKSGEEWPEREDYPDTSSRMKFSEFSSQPQSGSQKESETTGSPKKSRKTKRKASNGIKYHACQPIVITFDSLNVTRSSTISTLREYLYAEAKSKKGIEVNKALIKGMTAKEIPLQPNFSDCGLYLLAYIEKFVQDPDLFIRKLLQREMRTKEDWPPLRSGLLRSRLRKFMEQLYSEQEQLTKAKAEESALMVDQQPISYLLSSPVADEGKDEDKKRPVDTEPQPTESEQKKSQSNRGTSQSPESREPSGAERALLPANSEAQESVTSIEKPTELRDKASDPQTQPTNNEVVEVPDSQEQAKQTTIEEIQPPNNRVSVPSVSPKKKKRADTVCIDDSDSVEECTPPQRKEHRKDRKVEVQIQVRGTPPGSPHGR